MKWKPYFDPYIFQKVLEDVYLPPIAKEILDPGYVTHKQTFLFPHIRDRFLLQLEEQLRYINRAVKDETLFHLNVWQEYLNHSEEEKRVWFDVLREQYQLPIDYQFEENSK